MEPRIRAITPADDEPVRELVRRVMSEFGCDRDGFAFVDAELESMAAAYSGAGARFYVVEDGAGRVVGCGGFGPLADEDGAVCELRKMYFDRELRGQGVGTRLLSRLLDEMREAGFTRCYLETTSRMDAARALYARFGFRELAAPLGRTGHSGCDRYFARGLTEHP